MGQPTTIHVENRRLFEMAAGTAKLEAWEQNHLHTCRVCQGVLFVFINQQTSNPSPSPDEDSAAA